MGFGTALASLLGGYGAGKQANYQEQDRRRQLDLDQQRQDAEIKAQQAQQARQTALDTAQLRQAGLDANGQPLAPLQLNGLVQPGTPTSTPAPLPKGWHAPMVLPPPIQGQAPAWTPDDYLNAYQQAIAANRPDQAQMYLAGANAAALNASRESTAGLNAVKGNLITQGQIPLEQARAIETRAHANYYNALPGIHMADLRQKLQIAQAHDATRIAAINAQIAGAMQRAQLTTGAANQRAILSDDTRLDAVALANHYMDQRMDMQSAVRLAVQQASDAERIGQEQIAKGQPTTYDPSAPQYDPSAMFAPIMAAIAASRGGNQPGISFSPQITFSVDPKTGAVTQSKQPVTPNVNPNPTPNNNHNTQFMTPDQFTATLGQVTSQISAGTLDPQKAISTIRAATDLTAAQKAQALLAIQKAANPTDQPPPGLTAAQRSTWWKTHGPHFSNQPSPFQQYRAAHQGQ